MTTAAQTTHQGRIEDFSLGGRGVLVVCPELVEASVRGPDGLVAEGDEIQIRFSRPARGIDREFRARARVVGFFRGGMGVELVNPSARVLVALQDMANRTRTSARYEPEDAPSGADD